MGSQFIARLQDVPDLAGLTPAANKSLYVSAYSGGTATWAFTNIKTTADSFIVPNAVNASTVGYRAYRADGTTPQTLLHLNASNNIHFDPQNQTALFMFGGSAAARNLPHVLLHCNASLGWESFDFAEDLLQITTDLNNNLLIGNPGAAGSTQVADTYFRVKTGKSFFWSINSVNIGTWDATGLTVTGAFAATSLSGTGASITGLSAANISAGTLAVARGGTGLGSYTTGDLIYASGATTLAKLAGVAIGQLLKSGGVGTAFSWGTIASTDLSDTANIARLDGTQAFSAVNTFSNVTKQIGRLEVGPTSFTGSGTMQVYDATATTGITKLNIRIGAGQGVSPMFEVFYSDGTTSLMKYSMISGWGELGLRGGIKFDQGTAGAVITDSQLGMVLSTSGLDLANTSSIDFFTTNIATTIDIRLFRTANETLAVRADRTTSVAPTVRLEGKSTTTSARLVGSVIAEWADAADATAKGRVRVAARDGGVAVENIRTGFTVEADGSASRICFYDGGTAVAKQTVTGSRGGNAALADLLTKLAALNLIIDGTSA